ncbi:MAG: choice-of-anchor Q domain-containing protein, partial [Flavobacteriales bacterium]
IWVAAGQYRPTTGTNRTISFMLRNGVNMYGSFAGTETDVDQRDIAANPSTLNGDIGQLGLAADNSHSVVTANNITTAIVLDGFRIMNGNNTNGTHGGGLRVTNALGGEVLVRNCLFLNNQSFNYGGAAYLAAANLRLENCDLLNNSSSQGGAIHNGNNNGGYSNLVLRDCVFKGNTANIGACLSNTVRYDTLVVDRCYFTNNLSDNSVIVIDDFLSAKVMNSAIIGNSVNGFSSRVLRVNTFGSSTPPFDMTNCTIAHNRNTTSSPLQGEMVRLEDNHLRVTNCIIHGNTPYAGRQLNNGPIVRYSLVQGGHQNGVAIIDADPEFTAPNAAAPGNFDATAFDYALLPSSPAIDVGDDNEVDPDAPFDLALNDRIQGPAVDLGCYESSITTGFTEARPLVPSCYYDAATGEVVFHAPAIAQAAHYRVFAGNAQLLAQGRAAGDRTRLPPNPGIHLLTAEGMGTLRFVVP